MGRIMPASFYHIFLESGKDVYINPDHIMFAKHTEHGWELTMVNGYVFNFTLIGKLDNIALAAKITARHPM